MIRRKKRLKKKERAESLLVCGQEDLYASLVEMEAEETPQTVFVYHNCRIIPDADLELSTLTNLVFVDCLIGDKRCSLATGFRLLAGEDPWQRWVMEQA